MLFVLFKGLRVTGISSEHPFSRNPTAKKLPDVDCDRVESRWDWESFERVQGVAAFVTALSGRDYVGTDEGECVLPRFDVVQVPKVGDKVSYTFNGDYYPCGTVERVTKNLMVVTSTGHRFNRRKNTGSWVMPGGTWSLVSGHYTDKNESF